MLLIFSTKATPAVPRIGKLLPNEDVISKNSCAAAEDPNESVMAVTRPVSLDFMSIPPEGCREIRLWTDQPTAENGIRELCSEC